MGIGVQTLACLPTLGGCGVGGVSPCCMLVIRKGKKALSILRKPRVAMLNLICRMSLRTKKCCVAMSILTVHTPYFIL